jgi:hypothetical protein
MPNLKLLTTVTDVHVFEHILPYHDVPLIGEGKLTLLWIVISDNPQTLFIPADHPPV